MSVHCEIVEVRNSADAVGLACLRIASKQCSDCGAELCEFHAETCRVLPALFVVASGAAPESRLSGSRTTSGAKECLVRFLNRKTRLAFNHNFVG
jgi:hypothetical protein